MKEKTAILDTNIIIRILTNDEPKQIKQIEQLFNKSENESLEIPDLIIAEIIFVLSSVYKLEKENIIQKIDALISFDKFKTNKDLVYTTLEIFKNHNISFVDAYLLALVKTDKNEILYTFDKRLHNIPKTKAQEP